MTPLIAALEAATDRFMAKVIPEPNSGCWLWTGAMVPGKGRNPVYRGSFGIPKQGKPILAHRASFILHKGRRSTVQAGSGLRGP